jgi:hypothetical protein
MRGRGKERNEVKRRNETACVCEREINKRMCVRERERERERKESCERE